MSMKTTHDTHGGGRPRLIFSFGGLAQQGSEQREFDLLPGVTVIGSGAGVDLQLDGLADRHAEVRRDDHDEYVWVDLGADGGSTVDGAPVGEQALHTGDRIQLGDYTLSYYRDEFADHGRPHSGRQGGEPFQLSQDEPRPRGTSPEGGSEPTEDDPGEYY